MEKILNREPRKIQVFNGIDGVEFKEAWERRVSAVLNGISLKFLGKDDLIANKRAVGSPQDQIDLLELEKK